jgi:hypothetical protein
MTQPPKIAANTTIKNPHRAFAYSSTYKNPKPAIIRFNNHATHGFL